MGDTYKGESPTKKFARFFFWRDVMREYGREAFSQSHHVFLASRIGGDVSVLSALGVPQTRMWAVERDADAAAEFHQRWPGVTLFIGDIADVIEHETRAGWKPLTVFMDFCAPPCAETIDCVRRVSNAMPEWSTIGMAHMRGREPIAENLEPIKGLSRQQRRIWVSINRPNAKRDRRLRGASYGMAPSGEAVSARHFIGESAKTGNVDQSRTVDVFNLLQINPMNERLELLRLYNYQSATSDSNGVPMSIGVMRRRARGFAQSDGYDAVGLPRFTEDNVRRAVLDSQICVNEAYPMGCPDVAGLLNVPAGTAAAWRAHATRGTYSETGE